MQRYRRGQSTFITGAGVALVLLFHPALARGGQPQTTPAAAAAPAAERPAIFDEPHVLEKAISWAERFGRNESGRPKDGFYPDLGHMVTGAGWISAGPGYRHHLWADRAVVDVSGAVSWRAYKIAQATLELPYLTNERFAVGAQTYWLDFTQVRFFGVGPETIETDASDYRVKAGNVIGYLTWRPATQLAITGTGGWLARPTLSTSVGPFDRDEPDTMTAHPTAAGAGRDRQPSFLHADVAITFDSRDQPSYPTEGSLFRTAVATYRDRTDDAFTFDRFEFEAAQFIPMAGNRSVLAVHWWTVLSHTSSERSIPFYLMAGLGGNNTLRGYADYRFHDRHLMVVNAESRWALFKHVDGAVFVDAGNVAAHVHDLDFGRTSAGFGLRVHTSTSTLARFDVAHSKEGWRFLFKLSDSLRLARLSRRLAPLPFVP